EMRQAETALSVNGLRHSPDTAVQIAQEHVRRARDDFNGAASRLEALNPLLIHLGWIPAVGPEVSQAPIAARVANDTAGGVLALLDGIQPVFSGLHAHHSTLPILVGKLAAQRGRFDTSCADLNAARLARREIGASPAPALQSSLQAFDRQYNRLHTLCRGLALAPQLLGYGGPHTYLVAYQNPSELRASGGYIGSYGLVTMRNARMTERFSGTWSAISNVSVPPPQPMVQYNGEFGWLFMDSNWSPDFPTSAALERFFLKLNVGIAPPGVIDVTPQAAADVLAATGPIYIPEYRRWVNAGNIARLSDYYAHFDPIHPVIPNESAGAVDTQRKQFIGIVARHLLKRLDRLSAEGLVRLGRHLLDGVKQGDILLNFAEPREQQLARMLGASGGINRTSSDYLNVVDSNLSYNKINPWVTLAETYHVDVLPDRWLQADLTLRFADHAPLSMATHGEGPGFGKLGGSLDYASFVRIYVPAGAQLQTETGWTDPWSPGPAYDKTMFCGYLIVPHGQQRVIHLRYTIPPNVFSWSHGTRYRLVVQHQPGSRPLSFSASVTHDGKTDAWTVQRPLEDMSHVIPVAARSFHPIPLSRQSWPVVAPNHWIEPHAFLSQPYFHH
ncbi:MAG: DUF4012 domain-containing protein, partial [Chloroflexota bacterium]|nr:DUF4012 domain-containing protein [Chloroflexota bacterium]